MEVAQYDTLTPYARRLLDQAYERRERPRCSREDFADGFIAALIALRSTSSFKAGGNSSDGQHDG